MDASRVQPIKLARVTRVLGRTGSQGQCTQKIGKRAGKRKHSIEDTGERSRDGSFSDNMSEAESCVSVLESDPEDTFVDADGGLDGQSDGSDSDCIILEEFFPGQTKVCSEKTEDSGPDSQPEPKQSAPVKRARVNRGRGRGRGRVAAPQKKVAAPQKKVAAPQKKVAAPQKKVAAPQKKVAAPQKKVAAPQKKVAAPQKKVAAPQKKVAAPQKVAAADERRWCDLTDVDITPTQPTFRPARQPGCQLITTAKYSALQLFQQFFTNKVMMTLVKNTNAYGKAKYTKPARPWTEVTLQEMFSFLSLVVYMGFVKVTQLTDYWRKGHLYSLPFPRRVLTGRRFLEILSGIHLNSAEDDAANKANRGTSKFDRLGKIKPLYTDIRDACRRNYQPTQHISIDERMVATKARIMFKQYLKNKPVKWGFKLFVLADPANGYTWDFFVYEGKSAESTGKGLAYDTVMRLLNTKVLGTGFKLYVDNFYTSPRLFRDLLTQRIWACGTVRTHQAELPKTANNDLDAKSPRGSIRWIREDSMLFLKWRDTRDVSLCSTIHTAHGPETVARKSKEGGKWIAKEIPIPPAVRDYNKHMGGVDMSDALIGTYGVLHKTQKWYKTLFYHFVDIAIVNAFILHKSLCQIKGEVPMKQKGFRETLVLELAEAGSQKATPKEEEATPEEEAGTSRQDGLNTHHRPAYLSSSSKSLRQRCKKCVTHKTPVKCSTCGIPLCFMPTRDCYNEWHQEKM